MTKKQRRLVGELVKIEKKRHHDAGKVHVLACYATPALVVAMYEVACDVWVASAPIKDGALGRPHRGSLKYLMREGL